MGKEPYTLAIYQYTRGIFSGISGIGNLDFTESWKAVGIPVESGMAKVPMKHGIHAYHSEKLQPNSIMWLRSHSMMNSSLDVRMRSEIQRSTGYEDWLMGGLGSSLAVSTLSILAGKDEQQCISKRVKHTS